MTRLIAGAATALIATMLGTASVGAVDLSGGTLRGAASDAPPAAMEDLAALDIGDPSDPDDALDALAAEDAALGIGTPKSFVPVGGEPGVDDVATRPLEADGGDEDAGGADLASFMPRERFVESVPVLAAPAGGEFRPSVSRASASVVPLGSWTRSNPRASTVVLGGSWAAR